MSLVVIAKFTAKSEQRQELHALVEQTAQASWAEAGLVKYIVTSSESEPNVLVLVEFFETEGDYLSHRESQHLNEFRERVSGLLATEPEVFRGVPTLSGVHAKAGIF
jgi:quinol monooxygenase YgiN